MSRAAWAPSWWRVFLVGFILWIGSVAVTAVTRNINLVPTVVLLGSFLVPVTAVVWYLDRYQSPVLTGRDVLNGFLVGGVVGLLAASLLESWLLPSSGFVYLVVGLIEEAAKLLALGLIAWRLPHRSVKDGVVLGAAVGFGFAALESSGYALTALLSTANKGALSLTALVESELIRGLLAPFGHGLWTAVMGGVLFAAARGGRFRITWSVVLTYLGVSLLHSLWDYTLGIALILTLFLTNSPLRAIRTEQGVVIGPTPQQWQVFTAVEVGSYAVVSILGLLWLVLLWRRGSREAEGTPYSRRELA